MSDAQQSQETSLEARIKEAEVYRAMGLLTESMGVYEEILADAVQMDLESQETIHQNVEKLKREMALLQDGGQSVSAQDLSLIKETLSSQNDVQAILDSASAFKELGLYTEAVSEYEKLTGAGIPLETIVSNVAECLFRVYPPAGVMEQVTQLIESQNLPAKKKALAEFRLGLEMERRDHKDLALDVYRSAQERDRGNIEIKNKVTTLAATFASGSKYDYLLNRRMVTTEQLQKALAISKKANKSVEWILIEQFKIAKEAVGKSLSIYYGCPFKGYDPAMSAPIELISKLKKAFLLNELWVPIGWERSTVEIIIDDPRDLSKTDHIKSLLKAENINFYVAIREDIQSIIRHFFDETRTDQSSPSVRSEDFSMVPDISFEEEYEEPEEIEEMDEASGKVVRLVDQVMVAAYRKNASDIHVEPSPITRMTTIRMRLDGVCQDYMQVPNSMARGILSRLKIMAGLDIAERRLPQDGKIKFKRKGIPPFELRLACLPTAGGYEDAVLRILAQAGAMKIDEMGLNKRNLQLLKKIISNPHGLILAVGPTGSGKTTSLHAALHYINRPGIKIWTAEDPVEITQLGLRQVEAKPKIGLNFARIMRAFLRADPDVIMIGEMRDEETAGVGIEASLTGHLVFSTLHTNSAPETITRLLDMGLNPLNFSDAFLGVMAQRLVRKLCEKCREPYRPSMDQFQEMVTDYGEKYFGITGIRYSSDLTLYRPVGCEACSGTGYNGRLGIHELMEGTPEIKKMIKRQPGAADLLAQARKQGMTTLKQDGILKVFQGLTDMSEVRRVCIS